MVATAQILAIDPRIDSQMLQLGADRGHRLGIFTTVAEKRGGGLRRWWRRGRPIRRTHILQALAELLGHRLPGGIAKLNPVLLAVEKRRLGLLRMLEKSRIFQGDREVFAVIVRF